MRRITIKENQRGQAHIVFITSTPNNPNLAPLAPEPGPFSPCDVQGDAIKMDAGAAGHVAIIARLM
jgi:hypothetical protein